MRFLIFSDLHITNKNSKFNYNSDGVSDLLLAQNKFIEWLCQKAEDKDVDCILFLGDWTDYTVLDPITQYYSNKFIKDLVNTGCDVLLLEGNHCISDNKMSYTILSALDHIIDSQNCWCIYENKVVEIGENYRLHCFPYSNDFKELEKKIEESNNSLDSNYINILLFHFPTSNAMLDNGLPSNDGVYLSEEITSEFDICVGGDFHRPQKLSSHNFAYYVGAPFDLAYNQEGQRGIMILDINEEGYKKERIKNPFCYRMIKTESDKIKDINQNFSKVILCVTDQLTVEEKEELENKDFYKLNTQVEKTQNKEDLSESLLTLDKNIRNDEEMLKFYLKEQSIKEEIEEKALQIFKDIKNKGE